MKPIKLYKNLSIPLYIGETDLKRGVSPTPPTPITYLTQWKIVGNSEVHSVGNLTSWKVEGNSVVDNNAILSCGDYSNVDGKYHVKISNGVTIYDIPLTEPLHKVNDVADTIEFPATLEAFCNKDGSQIQTTLPDDSILHIRQIVKNGDFSNGTNSWNRARYISISASDNKLHIITNEAGESGNNYSWAGINEAVRAEVAVDENVYIHYTANPNRNMNVGLDGTGGGVYAQECVQDIDNDISCVKKLTTVNAWYFGFNKGTHEVNDEVIISNVYSFDLDAMFADCPSLKPSTASEFEALFTNINYIDYSDTATNVIVKGGKLYKYVEIEGKALMTRALRGIWIKDIANITRVTTTVQDAYRFKIVSNGKKTPDQDTIANILCNKYPTRTGNEVYTAHTGIASYTSGNIYIYDADHNTTVEDFINANLDTEVIYELNTPTTELVDVSSFPVSPTNTYTSANVVPYSTFGHTENKEIWSCGEYNPTDGKYHILVQPLGGSIADIALTEPLRKVNDVADTIEFPANTEGKALVTRNILSYLLEDLNWIKHGTENRYYAVVNALNCVIPTNGFVVPLILCNKYTTVCFEDRLKNDKQITAFRTNSDYVSITDSDLTSGSDIQGEILLQLATLTTELVDAPQIAEAESYSMVISQGAKAVEWSSFETE